MFGGVRAFAVCACCIQVLGRIGQDWGFVDVRPDAHTFWWLYFTTNAHVANYTERPLIVWLQGGPGMPSSGYGNFLEVGPLDHELQPRNGSFVENFNVLFVDNPAGVGYSHFTGSEAKLARNGTQIGEDLHTFFQIFVTEIHPEFADVPVYVFGESYGGKMAVEFVYNVFLKQKKRFCNLKGLALGDAYISPIDYINHYAPLALNFGLVDMAGYKLLDDWSKMVHILIGERKFHSAELIEHTMTLYLSMDTFGIDLYNMLAETNTTRPLQIWNHKVPLERLMNGEVKRQLNITNSNIIWKFFENDVYRALGGDLIQNVTDKVEALLNSTDIKIIVYNGLMDLLVNTAGTMSWLRRLKWEGGEKWMKEKMTPLVLNEISEGYSKKVDKLAFYGVLRAGHSVPIDNLAAINEILRLEILNELH